MSVKSKKSAETYLKNIIKAKQNDWFTAYAVERLIEPNFVSSLNTPQEIYFLTRAEAVKLVLFDGGEFTDRYTVEGGVYDLVLTPSSTQVSNYQLEADLDLYQGGSHVITEPCPYFGTLSRYGVFLATRLHDLDPYSLMDAGAHGALLEYTKKLKVDAGGWSRFEFNSSGRLSFHKSYAQEKTIPSNFFCIKCGLVDNIVERYDYELTIYELVERFRHEIKEQMSEVIALVQGGYSDLLVKFKTLVSGVSKKSDEYARYVAALCEVVEPVYFSQYLVDTLAETLPTYYGVMFNEANKCLLTANSNLTPTTFLLKNTELSLCTIYTESFMNSDFMPVDADYIKSMAVDSCDTGLLVVPQSKLAKRLKDCLTHLQVVA